MKIYILDTRSLPKSDFFTPPTEVTKKSERETYFGKKLLHYVLKKEYGITDPAFFRTSHGKPYLKNENIFFNISHSGSLVVCAISEHECGADIEILRDYNDKTAKRVCNENEYAKVSESSDKSVAFLEIWTRKEAFLKFTGTGLSVILNAIDTLSDPKFKTIVTDDFVLSTYSDNDFTREYIKIRD